MRLCLVTTTFNAEAFLERTIQSVINCAGFEHVDYIIVDGGSTDGTLDIIKKYEEHLKAWVSEPDDGMYHGIEKGFSMSDAPVMAWLNSDDVYMPFAIENALRIFAELPEVEWITSAYPIIVGGNDGRWSRMDVFPGVDREGFLQAETLPGTGLPATGFISQESVFWRRSLWEKAGNGFNHGFDLACDFDLWARFFDHAQLWTVTIPLAGFGSHGANLSQQHEEKYTMECLEVLKRYGHLENADIDAMRNRVAMRWFKNNKLDWLSLPNTGPMKVYRVYYNEIEDSFHQDVY